MNKTMKKALLLTAVVSLVTLMVGCSSKRPSELSELRLQGDIVSFEQEFHPETDEYAYADLFFHRLNIQKNCEVVFDDNGYITSITNFFDNDYETEFEYRYDKNGFILEYTIDSTGDFELEAEFDSEDDVAILEDGVLEGEAERLSGGEEIEMAFEYTYDEEGYIIKEEMEDDTVYAHRTRYTYDDDRHLTKMKTKYEDNTEVHEFEYEEGVLVSYVLEDDFRELEYEFEYEYDDQNNWIEMKVYIDDDYVGYVEREYEYK